MSTLEMIIWLTFAVATFALLGWTLFASADWFIAPSRSDRPDTKAGSEGGGAMSERLTPMMLAVLDIIAHPHPDDEPYPPTGTVKALMRRGLVRRVNAREEMNGAARSSMDIIMAALGSQRLVATPAGHAALRCEDPRAEREDR